MKDRIDNWIYIDDIKEIPKDTTAIHCDTRDFHCLFSKEEPNLEGLKAENLIKHKSAKKSMLITKGRNSSLVKEYRNYIWRKGFLEAFVL